MVHSSRCFNTDSCFFLFSADLTEAERFELKDDDRIRNDGVHFAFLQVLSSEALKLQVLLPAHKSVHYLPDQMLNADKRSRLGIVK